jgi:hypothetical protein
VFDDLYDSAKHSALPHDAWYLLEPVLPNSSFWFEWDRSMATIVENKANSILLSGGSEPNLELTRMSHRNRPAAGGLIRKITPGKISTCSAMMPFASYANAVSSSMPSASASCFVRIGGAQ